MLKFRIQDWLQFGTEFTLSFFLFSFAELWLVFFESERATADVLLSRFQSPLILTLSLTRLETGELTQRCYSGGVRDSQGLPGWIKLLPLHPCGTQYQLPIKNGVKDQYSQDASAVFRWKKLLDSGWISYGQQFVRRDDSVVERPGPGLWWVDNRVCDADNRCRGTVCVRPRLLGAIVCETRWKEFLVSTW